MKANLINFIILFLVFWLHIPLLFLPSSNLEFAFADLINFFNNGNLKYYEQFKYYQANTVSLSLVGSLFSQFFNFSNNVLLLRLINTVALLFFAITFIKICRFNNIQNISIKLILLIINPIIWIFSARATADFLPGMFCILAFYYFEKSTRFRSSSFISSLFYSASVAIKPTSIFFIIFIFFYAFKGEFNSNRKNAFINFFIISAVLVILLLLFQQYYFGYFVTPLKFQTIHISISFLSVLSNYILYMGYLGIIFFPIYLSFKHSLDQLIIKKLMILIVLSFMFGFIFLDDFGELNFGFIENYLPKRFLNGLLASFGILFLTFLMSQIRNEPKKYLAISIILSILFLSLFRPSQRYLLPIIPFLFLFINSEVLNKKFLGLVLVITISINALISSNQYIKGIAAQEMYEEILSLGVVCETQPNMIEGVLGNMFYDCKDQPKNYIVSDHPNNKYPVISVSKKFLFLEYSLYLNKNH